MDEEKDEVGLEPFAIYHGFKSGMAGAEGTIEQVTPSVKIYALREDQARRIVELAKEIVVVGGDHGDNSYACGSDELAEEILDIMKGEK